MNIMMFPCVCVGRIAAPRKRRDHSLRQKLHLGLTADIMGERTLDQRHAETHDDSGCDHRRTISFDPSQHQRGAFWQLSRLSSRYRHCLPEPTKHRI